MKIAVLDQLPQASWLCEVLTGAGYLCHAFSSAEELLAQLPRQGGDMIVMNWGLPDVDGTRILKWAREKKPPNLPVLFITSRSREDDIISGLAAGADDYLIEPVRRGELIVRVGALLRRAYPHRHTGERLQFGAYIFDIPTHRLTMTGVSVELTQKEFDLALLFFRHLGHALSRTYILKEIWSRDVAIPSRTMDTHVSRVRTKLRLTPENGFRLTPVYGYGYRLDELSK